MSSSEDERPKVSFKVIIPENFEIDNVEIFRKIKGNEDELEQLEAQDIEEYDSEDDSDYYPVSSDEDDSDDDPYEYAELSEKDKAKLKKELQQLILDNEWEEFNQS